MVAQEMKKTRKVPVNVNFEIIAYVNPVDVNKLFFRDRIKFSWVRTCLFNFLLKFLISCV